MVSSKGIWLCERKYNGNSVWSDVFARKAAGDEPAWETATRSLYSHPYLNANPANGQRICYTANRSKCVCYLLPVPHGVDWPEPDANAQWFLTLPDSLHPRLWRGSPLHSAIEECAGRGWHVYASPARHAPSSDAVEVVNSIADRTAWLDLQYTYGTHSKVGERCVAAGHITCPREYARTLDPFSGFGKLVKEVAIGRFGTDFDDGTCYPTITAAIIPVVSHMAELFTAYKQNILVAIGLYYSRGWRMIEKKPENEERPSATDLTTVVLTMASTSPMDYPPVARDTRTQTN